MTKVQAATGPHLRSYIAPVFLTRSCLSMKLTQRHGAFVNTIKVGAFV